MNKEQFYNACERARRGFLTALQWVLCLLIAPAFLVVVFIIWIDNAKYDLNDERFRQTDIRTATRQRDTK